MPLPLAVIAPVASHLHGGPQDSRRTYRIAILAEGFLATELPTFRSAALKVVQELLSTQPFKRQRDRIFITAIDCTSLASARVLQPLTNPPQGYVDQTPFGATFNMVIAREINGDRTVVRSVIAAVPGLPPIDVALVIVNNDFSGGLATGDVAWLTLQDVGPTFVHELGHAGFGLADEYDYRTGASGETPRTFNGAEPLAPNVTIQTIGADVPWRAFLRPSFVPIPTTLPNGPGPCVFNHPVVPGVPSDAVGLFEGASQHACGIFRPARTCKMREPGPFCPVCEATIFGRLAGTIVDARPPFTVAALEWTHAAPVPPPLADPGRFDIAAYNTKTGLFAMYFANEFQGNITPAGTPRGMTQLDPGFLTMTCFGVGTEQFVYLDSFFNNRRMIFRIDSKGMLLPGNPALITLFERPAGPIAPPPATAGFSHTVALTLAGQSLLLHYDRVTGGLELEAFNPAGGAPVPLASTAGGGMLAWHPLLSSLTTVTIGGIPHVVGLDASARSVTVARLSFVPGGVSGLTDLFQSAGFVLPFQTHALGVDFHDTPMLFTYSTLGGTGSIYEIRPDRAGLDHLYGWTLAPGAAAVHDLGLPAFGFMPPVGIGNDGVGRLWFYNAGLRRFSAYVWR